MSKFKRSFQLRPSHPEVCRGLLGKSATPAEPSSKVPTTRRLSPKFFKTAPSASSSSATETFLLFRPTKFARLTAPQQGKASLKSWQPRTPQTLRLDRMNQRPSPRLAQSAFQFGSPAASAASKIPAAKWKLPSSRSRGPSQPSRSSDFGTW